MSTLRLNKYELHYDYNCADRNKPTLLLIHDLCMDASMWQTLHPFIDKGFNTLTYDLYGHGKTTDSESPMSLRQLFDEMVALLRCLKLNKVHIIGCRFSAFLAFEFAIHAPEYVESLTLMSFPFYTKGSYDREGATNIQLIKLDHELFIQKYILKSVHPVTAIKVRAIKHAFSQVHIKNIISPIEELISISHSSGFDLIGKLKQLRTPVLFMHGELDPVFPAALAMIFSNYISNSRFHVIPDASSLIPLDNPEHVGHLINLFLNSNRVPSTLPPNSKKLINTFNGMIENAYKSQINRHRFLNISILSGKTHVYWNGQEIIGKWSKRNAQEILLFIILNNGATKRETIINAFTPDMDINQARNHLRVQLSYLNQIFRSQSDPSLHDLLMISRDSVALNANVESDIGDYIQNISDLLWSKESISERCQTFLNLLEDYRPDVLSALNGEWSRQLAANLKSKWSQTMTQILLALKDEGHYTEITSILTKGRIVEPYEGFCDHWMTFLTQNVR